MQIKEDSHLISVPVDAHFFQKELRIPSEAKQLLRIGLYVNQTERPPELATVGFGISGNNDAVQSVCYKNYLDGGHGEYMNRFKAVNIEANGDYITIFIKSNLKTTAKAYSINIHFIYATAACK